MDHDATETEESEETLPEAVEQAIRSLASGDRDSQGSSYQLLQEATAGKVGWADRAWTELKPLLCSKDNRVRSIVGQMLCNIASSASTCLVDNDLDRLMLVTHDERFVTARHVLLALWKVGVEDLDLRRKLLDRLSERFTSSDNEKNGSLVRYDILCAMRSLFDVTGDASVKAVAMALAATEHNDKYRKKYLGVWRGV